jgi:hypothetical protein
MTFVYCWLFVSLVSVLGVDAATLRSAPMVGVWAATGTPLRATVALQDAQDRSQPATPRGGRTPAVQGVVLDIHPDELPTPASPVAPHQVFSVVDVGRDACEITYYEAVARGPSGTPLRLMLADRRSAVRLECLTHVTKGRPSWSVAVYEVNDSAAELDIAVQRPIAYLDGAPDGDDDVEGWRDQRFRDAWVGIIGERRHPLTAQTHYAFTAVEHVDPYVLDFDSARGALHACGPHFMEAVLEPVGKAPLVEPGGVRTITYWRIVQCRRR